MTPVAAKRPPIIQSALEVAVWLIVKAAAEHSALDPRKLNLLLYIAQANHLQEHSGRLLFPGIFLAQEEGPIEPNVTLALKMGLNAPQEPSLDEYAIQHLEGVWLRYGALPNVALMKLVANDGAWKSIFDKSPGSEIPRVLMAKGAAKLASLLRKRSENASKNSMQDRELQSLQMRKAYNAKIAQAMEDKEQNGLKELPKFLLDGRALKRWQPKRSAS